MNEFIEKLIRHDIKLNSLEQSEDKTVIKFKACVLDFKQSHNGWAISKNTCEQRMHTLVNKHIVVRYYSEDENGGLDAFGDHEETSVKLRGTEIMLPSTNTHSVGTITNAYIDYVEPNNPLSGEAVWIDGVILAMENINEASLLLEWQENDIPILTSVEWYYTQDMYDNDGIQWIVDPTFSNLCILNSEDRGNKPVIYGNYDCSHIELMINQLNQAVKDDLAINNKQNNGKGEDMENRFIKALNGLSVGELSDKVYAALRGVMTCDEYYDTYVSDYNVFYDEKFFIYHVYKTDGCEYYKVTFELDADENIVIDFENKQQVKREQVWVTVETAQGQVEEVQQQLNKVQSEKEELEKQLNTKTEEIVSVTEEKISLSEQIVSLNSTIAELEPFKVEHDKAEFEKALNEKVAEYEPKFAKFNALEVFNSEEVQGLIKDTLDVEKGLNAKLAIYEKLDEVIESFNMIEDKDTPVGNVDKNTKSLNNLVPTPKSYVDKFGFDV